MTQNSNPKEELRKLLLAKLPPIIARKEVPHFLGGIISPKTLANADSLGEGPQCVYRLGKTIAYPAESLVDWLIDTVKITYFNRSLKQYSEALGYAQHHE